MFHRPQYTVTQFSLQIGLSFSSGHNALSCCVMFHRPQYTVTVLSTLWQIGLSSSSGHNALRCCVMFHRPQFTVTVTQSLEMLKIGLPLFHYLELLSSQSHRPQYTMTVTQSPEMLSGLGRHHIDPGCCIRCWDCNTGKHDILILLHRTQMPKKKKKIICKLSEWKWHATL